LVKKAICSVERKSGQGLTRQEFVACGAAAEAKRPAASNWVRMSAQRRMARSGARDEQGDCVWAKGLFLSGELCESQNVEDACNECYHEGQGRTRGVRAVAVRCLCRGVIVPCSMGEPIV
jgi:hypothetical protein